MKLHAWTIKTNGKWSTSHSAKFGLWSRYLLYTSFCFCRAKRSVYLPLFLIAPISVFWSTCTEKVAPCVGQCITVTTFYILWNLLSESMHFCKRLGWGNKQRGVYVSGYSACEKMVPDVDGLEHIGRGGTGHWPWRLLWFGFNAILLWLTEE